jgi:hypothetical protein
MIGDTANVDNLTRTSNLRWDEAERELAVFDVRSPRSPSLT